MSDDSDDFLSADHFQLNLVVDRTFLDIRYRALKLVMGTGFHIH